MKVIDVHSHHYPPAYMAHLEGRPGSPTMVRTGPGTGFFRYEGVRLATVSVPGHYDPQPRLQDMDRYGIDVQMVSLTTPGVELLPREEGITWARKVNDDLAEICRSHAGRLYHLAALPYQDVPAAVKELERCRLELGARGITIFSNIRGVPIYDPRFLPVYEAAQEYELPIFLHPAPPLTTEAMNRARLPLPLFGFVFDTTMAVAGLIFQGVFERFPKLRVIHAHLGGTFPYLVGRINDCFHTYAKDYGYSLPGDPSEYYRRNVWDDAISFHLPAMRCALEFMGADHLVIGTDYAHPIGGPDKVEGFVRALDLPPAQCEEILWRNAAGLFHLDV